MGNWARIHQRSGKTSFEVTKRGILRKGRFRQIWQCAKKIIKGLAKYSNEMTKRGMLIGGDFKDNDKSVSKKANLEGSYQRFDKNLQRDDKKGHLDKWRL